MKFRILAVTIIVIMLFLLPLGCGNSDEMPRENENPTGLFYSYDDVAFNNLQIYVLGDLDNHIEQSCFLQVGIPHYCKLFSLAPIGNFLGHNFT